jgi:hypothetical protein
VVDHAEPDEIDGETCVEREPLADIESTALWGGHRLGAQLTLALLPVEVAAWIAFALPILPLLAVGRVILLVIGWSALR